ncbi:hypothetical protein ACFX19_044840 [Malus domestica]
MTMHHDYELLLFFILNVTPGAAGLDLHLSGANDDTEQNVDRAAAYRNFIEALMYWPVQMRAEYIWISCAS